MITGKFFGVSVEIETTTAATVAGVRVATPAGCIQAVSVGDRPQPVAWIWPVCAGSRPGRWWFISPSAPGRGDLGSQPTCSRQCEDGDDRNQPVCLEMVGLLSLPCAPIGN